MLADAHISSLSYLWQNGLLVCKTRGHTPDNLSHADLTTLTSILYDILGYGMFRN